MSNSARAKRRRSRRSKLSKFEKRVTDERRTEAAIGQSNKAIKGKGDKFIEEMSNAKA